MLPDWNDSNGTRALLAAIDAMTTPGEPGFVPPAERVVTIDNDGTLWCEKPMYVQVDFIIRRWKEMLAEHPELADEQPFRALVEQDLDWFRHMREDMPLVLKAVGDAFSGITPEHYEHLVERFFAEARHPVTRRPYAGMIYAPMRSLIDYLHRRDFRVYITTGGERDFVRVISEPFYGVGRENVIGTTGELDYRRGELLRTARLTMPINEHAGKPAHIYARTGRRPVIAIGNADGDFEMLEYARIGVVVRHDDADREFAYDAGAEYLLAAAKERDWIVLSMKHDFATLYPDEGERSSGYPGDC